MPALTDNLIAPVAPETQPLADQAPAPAKTPALAPAPAPTPKTSAKPELPDIAKKDPLVRSVLLGEVPGILIRPGLYYPKAWDLAEKHSKDLMDLGLDFYFATDESTIFFNPAQITEPELQAADKGGKLHQILPDYETLSGERPQKPPPKVQKQMDQFRQQVYGKPPNVSLAPGQLPPSAPPLPQALAAPQAVGPTLPAKSVNKLMQTRLGGLTKVSPSSGPFPGAGRIVNAMATPAI